MLLRCLIFFACWTAAVAVEKPSGWGGWFGPVAGELKLPGARAGDFPLVTTGAAGAGDLLALHVTGPGRVCFDFSHAGRRVARSAELELAADHAHRFVVSMGSLLPPLSSSVYGEHPAWLHLTRQLLVLLDGRPVLARPAEFSPSAAGQISVDEKILLRPAPAAENEIAGAVLPLMAGTVKRDPLWRGFPGPLQVTVRANADAASGRQPLLSTGRLGAGDLLYWQRQSDGRVRLGWAHAGADPIESEPLPLRDGAQELLIAADSLLPPPNDELAQREPELGRLRGALFVELNGRVAWSRPAEFHPTRPDEIVLGADVVHSRPAVRYFEGGGEAVTPLAPADVIMAQARIVDRVGAPAAEWEGWPGPVRLRVRFPANRPGIAEPLLCCGRTGAADLVYVRYVDANHVCLAVDHWGLGGPVSEPLEIDPAATQEIGIAFGALFPPAGSSFFARHPDWRGRREEARVTLNGRVAIAAALRAHPSTPEKIFFGQNPVGASSCVPEFTGTLVGIQAAPEALASAGR